AQPARLVRVPTALMATLAASQVGLRRSTIAAGVGALFFVAGIATVLLKTPDPQRLIIGLGYMAALAMVAWFGVFSLRAPNWVLYPALLASVPASVSLGAADAIEALLGGLACFVVLLVAAVAGRGAMGVGDVKAGTLCGILVGLHGVIPLLLVTFLSGAAMAAPLVLFKIRRRTDTIAFTPFMVGAAMLCVAFLRLSLWD